MMTRSATLPFGENTSKISVYMPLLMGLSVIAMESTKAMGAHTTDNWLLSIINLFHSVEYSAKFEAFNQLLRKSGHFLGYGLLGVVAARVWYAFMRTRFTARWAVTRAHAAMAGIMTAAIVAGCDEIHQVFLPTRGGCVHDVLLDTAGALLLNVVFFAVISIERKRRIHIRLRERIFGCSYDENAHPLAGLCRLATRASLRRAAR